MTTAPARAPEPITLDSHARRFTQQMRVRVGIAICMALIVVNLTFSIQSALIGRWTFAVLDMGTVVLGSIAVYLFRRSRRTTLPGLLVLGWMLLGYASVGITQEGLPILTSVWAGLFALLSLYLLGPRHGSIVLGILLLEIAVFWTVHQTGVSLPHADVAPDSRWTIVFNAAGVALIGLLGYLYEAAQKRSLGELADALIASEQNERQLDALFESTPSAICSLDRDLRLLTCNQAFAALLRPGASPPTRGDALSDILTPAQYARWQAPIERVLAGGSGLTSLEESPSADQDGPHRETVMHPIVSGERVTGVTVFSRDITARKRAEAELRRLNQELVRVSRSAGMAAVASEVLHNAGNVLNSTGVSVSMLERHVKNLKTEHLARAVDLLEQHGDAVDAFLRDDPRGRRVIELLRGLTEHFGQQQQQLAAELASLRDNTEHLTRVIHAQQGHARALGIIETVPVAELIGAALELQAPSWTELGIAIEHDIATLPPLLTDRHKVIEILLNLVSNARHALRDSDRPDKRLRIRAEAVGDDRVRVHVEDNGPGIAPEHRDRVFRLGFTTKPDGNGIGLHASAIAAQQLGGTLSYHSDGPGFGATFTLELPVAPAGPAGTTTSSREAT
jgi:two-component system sensor kinase FixL